MALQFIAKDQYGQFTPLFTPHPRKDNRMTTKPPPGTLVRLTSGFLQSTGQHTGGEPRSVWTVVPCSCGLCSTGPFICTNEPAVLSNGDGRHINYHNLEEKP